MRPLWAPSAGEYLRTWLLCGEFPMPAMIDDESGDAHSVPGFDDDFLLGRGGEATLCPVAGMTHARTDGSLANWKKYTSKTDGIDYKLAFEQHPYENVVWYAFTTVTREQMGMAVFALESNCSSKLWLNGEMVHVHPLLRDTWYNDRFTVSLRAGENVVMLKMAQQINSGHFAFRVLETAQAQVMELTDMQLSPSIARESTDDKLVLHTDTERDPLLAVKAPVQVSVLAPGGRVVAEKTVTRGETVNFASADWPPGPYDVRFTMQTPKGNNVFAYQLWYHGNAFTAVQKLVDSAPAVDDTTPSGMIHAMLAEMVVDRLGEWSKSGDRHGCPQFRYAGDTRASPHFSTTGLQAEDLPAIYPELMEFAELQGESQGSGPLHANGFVRLAYRDDIDNSAQFCRVYLPMDYTPGKRYPLLISLHGRSDEFPPYVHEWGSDQRHEFNADQYGVIVAYPYARGNSWFRGMGDRDVMHCLRMLKERFPIDENRVYLLGYSMGGAGVWYVGSRHPEQFAAVAPFFGGYDYRFQLNDAALQKLTLREQYRRERLSYIAQAEALRSMPLLASHGDADTLVPVEYSRYTLRMLQRWGFDARYWEHPGKGHGGLGNDGTVIPWLLAHTREENPAHVSLRSADLRYAAAYWVKIEQRDDPYAFMQADVEVPAPNVIRLNTKNVLEITLTPRAPLIDPDKPVRILWNNTDLRTVTMNGGAITLRAQNYQPAVLHKRPELEGPANDLYNTPFAIVVGTISPDPIMRRLCDRAAQRLLAWWHERFHSAPRYFRDIEISEAEQARYSLLLLGGPADNAVAAALSTRIPLQITANAVTIDGHAFPVHDAAVQMLYPNPRNADRYVLLRAATSPAGMYCADYVLNDVDFCLVDSRAAQALKPGTFFDLITGRNAGPPIAAGYFDNAWHYQDTLVERWPAVARAKFTTWKMPKLASASPSAQRVMLADLVESKAEGAFLDLRRDRNAAGGAMKIRGKHYSSGLAIVPTYWQPGTPCAIEYDLSGGAWTRLRATIALELPGYAVSIDEMAHTWYEFAVKGDGLELYHSPPLNYATSQCQIAVDISGVKVLRLEVLNYTTGACSLISVDWADARVEK